MYNTKKELIELLGNRTDDMEYVAVTSTGSHYVNYHTIPKRKLFTEENITFETKLIKFIFENCESLYLVMRDEMKMVWKINNKE
jgi:hypothetical protein